MLSNEALGRVALNALSAMVKIFMISCVGVACSRYPRDAPLLPPSALRVLSRLSNLVLLPALIIVSLGSALSVTMVARTSVLIMFCLLTNLISYAVAYTLGYWLFEKDKDLFLAASVAVGSPNAISFPLMLMQTLCEQQLVNQDFSGNSVRCMSEANSMLFVYSIGWHLMFWSYGFPMLETLGVGIGSGVEKGRDSLHIIVWTWLKRTLISPSMLAIYVGLLVGLVTALQNALFKDFTFLRPLGSALRTLSEPVVCINCLVMSANLAQIDLTPLREISDRVFMFRVRAQSIVSIDAIEGSPPPPPPHPTPLSTKSVVGDACISSITINAITTSPLHRDEEEEDGDGNDGNTEFTGEPPVAHMVPQVRSVISFLLCRLILPPLVMIPILRLAVDADFVGPNERLMQLVVCIEAAAPSAQLIIVSLTQLGKTKVASQMAFLYLCQYLFSILTITVCTSIAMSVIY